MRQWLPIGCVVVLLGAVAFVVSRRGMDPSPPAGRAAPPSNNLVANPPAAPQAPPSASVPNAASANPEPLGNQSTPSIWLRSVVGVAPPVPVVDEQPDAAPVVPVAMAPTPVVEPALPVPVAQMVHQTTSPAMTTPPASAATTPRWQDNAPSTALEDAARRDWPYPPMGQGLAPGTPLVAAIDPSRQEQTDPLAGWGPPPAPSLDPRRFTEAHWQGIEVVPNTPLVAQALKIPPDAQGVIVDDVTLPADLQGFQGGDLVTHVAGVTTPDLTSFIDSTDRVRDLPQTELTILRNGQSQRMALKPLKQRLGTANGETASMIRPGARMPHPYRGPCTNCHRIGTTGTIPVDQGDMMVTAIPTIRADAVRPHRDRGPCRACHQVVP